MNEQIHFNMVYVYISMPVQLLTIVSSFVSCLNQMNSICAACIKICQFFLSLIQKKKKKIKEQTKSAFNNEQLKKIGTKLKKKKKWYK